MSDELLGNRRKALEDQFFVQQDRELIEAMREKREGEARREALRVASGISDQAVLDHLSALGIGPEALAALSLVPLVAVAWADGRVDEPERRAVLRGAESQGVKPGESAYQLLAGWLDRHPGSELVSAWKEYASALCAEIDSAARARLREDLMGRARAVAESAGGFLGLGSVSSEEAAVLEDLERALA